MSRIQLAPGGAVLLFELMFAICLTGEQLQGRNGLSKQMPEKVHNLVGKLFQESS